MGTCVVDTHSLVWFIAEDDHLSKDAERLLDQAEAAEVQVLVPTIVLAETTYITQKKRLKVTIDAVLNRIEQGDGFAIVPFDFAIFQTILQLPDEWEIHDRIIAATGRYYNRECERTCKVMLTALELSRDEFERYLETARRRSILPALTSAERVGREALIGRVREAATVLKTRFGARRVVLFGSLAHEAWFVSDSDVDLAVEGLGSSDYWVAWRVVEELIDNREVDLIEIEAASDSLRKAIQRYGMEL